MKPKFISWSSEEGYEETNEPVRTSILRKGVGIIDMEYNDEQMVMYCPHCKAAGFHVKLGPKILMPGETRQPDFDKWLICPDCYEVVAAYVVEGDASVIKDDIPTVETPFESGFMIEGMPRRTSRQGVKTRKKRDRPTDSNPEIQRELDRHGESNVHIIK